ncbi:hypothetical protein YC2023_115210 [Brassica napus]
MGWGSRAERVGVGGPLAVDGSKRYIIFEKMSCSPLCRELLHLLNSLSERGSKPSSKRLLTIPLPSHFTKSLQIIQTNQKSNSHGGSRRFSVSNICIKSLCWFPSCRSVSDSTPMIRYMIKWLIVIYGHLGPTPSHSILRNSLQVGETLPIKRHNVKRGGELIGVDMLLLDSKATLMPGSSPSHHLQTALKGGFYAALMSLVNRTGFLNSRRTLQVSKSKSAAWPSQHKYPASRNKSLSSHLYKKKNVEHSLHSFSPHSDVSGTLSMFDSDAVSFHSHLDG